MADVIDCLFVWDQVAIPVVPTVKVVVTFTKFVELQSTEQFFTPLSSPSYFPRGSSEDDKKSSSSSWLRRNGSQSANKQRQSSLSSSSSSATTMAPHWGTDPFAIPSGYTWTSIDDDKSSNKMKRSKSTRKSK